MEDDDMDEATKQTELMSIVSDLGGVRMGSIRMMDFWGSAVAALRVRGLVNVEQVVSPLGSHIYVTSRKFL